MHKQIKVFLAVVLFSFTTATINNATARVNFYTQADQVEAITITSLGYGNHLLAWNALSGTGAYNVHVMNLTSNATQSAFSTYNTNAILSGLMPGNSYRVTIQKGTQYIIDIIDIA